MGKKKRKKRGDEKGKGKKGDEGNLKEDMKLATLLTAATTLAAGAGTVAAQAQQQQPDATGAPLPGLNWTGVSTEGIVTVVTVVDRFLTYCAESTVFAWGPKVYSVTAPATLTITDCPCTITTVCSLFLLFILPLSPSPFIRPSGYIYIYIY